MSLLSSTGNNLNCELSIIIMYNSYSLCYRLAIGSETGLVIIDININQILHVLGNITSILCTYMYCSL